MTPVEELTLDWSKSRDLRNYEHLAADLLPETVERKAKSWRSAYWRIDQGPDGACVGFGWLNEAMAWPVANRPKPYTLAGCNALGHSIYHGAQAKDEFRDTPPEEGSSVNGGGKEMRDRGFIEGWKWHESVDTIIDGLIVDGPQVMGSNWLNGMFYPDTHGIVRITGQLAGGHCYLATGYYPSYYGTDVIRCRQSWGADWGKKGDFYIPVPDLRGLWADDGVECAMPVGRKLVKA